MSRFKRTKLQSTDNAQQSTGWVYILSHPHINAIKVGYTTRTVNSRIQELSHTSVPGSFIWEYGVRVVDPYAAEQQTHSILDEYRVHVGREFFSCSLPAAISAILEATRANPPIEFYDRNELQREAKRVANNIEALKAWDATNEAATNTKIEALRNEAQCLEPDYFTLWFLYCVAAIVVLAAAVDRNLGIAHLIGSALLSSGVALFHQHRVHQYRIKKARIPARKLELEDSLRKAADFVRSETKAIRQGRDFRPPLTIPFVAESQSTDDLASSQVPRPAPLARPANQDAQVGPNQAAAGSPISVATQRVLTCRSCNRTFRSHEPFTCEHLRCPVRLLDDA